MVELTRMWGYTMSYGSFLCVLPTIKLPYEHALYCFDGESRTGCIYYPSGIFDTDRPFSVMITVSQHRQKHNFSTSVPLHRTISPKFCGPPITHPLTNNSDSFFHDGYWAYQCYRLSSLSPARTVVRTCIYFCIPVKLIPLFRTAPLVSPMICIPPSVLHAFPSLSFWGAFGTGASMVLW